MSRPRYMLFWRIASSPVQDLDRGTSYSAGAFGDAEEEHEGLSAVSCESRGVDGALEWLDEYMGLSGTRADGAPAWVCLFRGIEVGQGPELESLISPMELVLAVSTVTLPSNSIEAIDRLVAMAEMCATASELEYFFEEPEE